MTGTVLENIREELYVNNIAEYLRHKQVQYMYNQTILLAENYKNNNDLVTHKYHLLRGKNLDLRRNEIR